MPRKEQYAIASLISQPVYLYSFQTTREQLKLLFPTQQYQLFDTKKQPYRFNYRVDMLDRLNLLKTGRFCTLLIQKLLCMKNQQPIRNKLRLGTAISSRHNYFDKVEPTCVASWVVGQYSHIFSVTFHPTKPLILTCSYDNIVRLWRMNLERTTADGVAILRHNIVVSSATFHPTEPLHKT
jgi:WD40 repeat protein